jgi:hypothetical protein
MSARERVASRLTGSREYEHHSQGAARARSLSRIRRCLYATDHSAEFCSTSIPTHPALNRFDTLAMTRVDAVGPLRRGAHVDSEFAL